MTNASTLIQTVTEQLSKAADRIAEGLENLAQAQAAQQPESPASVNFKMISPNGVDVMFTVRNESMAHIIQKLPDFEKALLNGGYTPTTRRPAPASMPPVATSDQTSGQTDTGTFSVTAVEFGGFTAKGDELWKVKGGNFVKYGVPMYPEAVQASNLQIALNPASPPHTQDIAGWKAHYTINGGGKPKITRLTRS